MSIQSSYTPLTIPDARFIYDARYVNGLESDNPVADSAIAQWNDLSGLRNHQIQSTGALQPILKASIFGESPALYTTNAAQQLMTCTGNDTLNPSLITLFSVVKYTAVSALAYAVVGKNASGAIANQAYGFQGVTTTNTFRIHNQDGTILDVNQTVTSNVTYIQVGYWDGATSSFDINGTVATGSLAGTIYPTTTSNLVLFQQKAVATRTLDGYVGFVAGYGRLLSSDEILAVKRYLANNFGGQI